ncbi:Proteasome subunit alpha type-6 [Puccinia graminis f. sp. tritici]|uniref:Proteasome subunit alpha type-6 n=1 Tax=Puccinia graminis f. sp. tritici TaxID=56615 RepID=A0A5B0NE01_PUCGR|nr:Proteasome subunit alpha type-6 [Puccinia graminis f. sp. tritici]
MSNQHRGAKPSDAENSQAHPTTHKSRIVQKPHLTLSPVILQIDSKSTPDKPFLIAKPTGPLPMSGEADHSGPPADHPFAGGERPRKRRRSVKLALATVVEHPELVRFRRKIREIVSSSSLRGPRQYYASKRRRPLRLSPNRPLKKDPNRQWMKDVLREVDTLISESVLMEIVVR